MTMRPTVQLVGDAGHADFRDANELLRAGSHIADKAAGTSPELIVIAQSRPGVVSRGEVERVQRRAPLAGVVALLGTWCEGESRTGRPWPGVARLYWYEFPAWWRRQLALRAAGRCPDWARPADFDFAFRISDCGLAGAENRNSPSGVIVLSVPCRDTRATLSDIFRAAGYAVVWQRNGRPECDVQGAAAGIWDGGQLNECEAEDLEVFCRRLSCDKAPVIALLDFPRRDRVQRALELGAAAVLGKPWRNQALLITLHEAITNAYVARAA